ncbi:MAG TPA: DUF4911 domain-containing protein [Polyangia bacterium]|nr:DUF4911 domain-containing protein [Polyangia bacterium]
MKDDLQRRMLLRSIRVERKSISYLRWLLESHDGLATPTTREGTDDIVDLMVAPDMALDLDDLLAALAVEMPLEHVPCPSVPPL